MTDVADPNPAAIAWPEPVAVPRRKAGWLAWVALSVSLVLLSPIIAVVAAAFGAGSGTWAHLAATVLPLYVINTVVLVVAVTVGVFVIGTGTAWLVTMCRFPGKRVLEWALILPFAAPAYVIAYAYTDFLQHPGPVQTWLRALTGWGPRDYWFPEIRSLEGAAVVFTLVLYPYVYLLARAAFLQQSACTLEVARTLGRTPWTAFFRVALPMARPAIAVGVSLALMETLADFGTVAHFGVQTFTTGIYRAWFSMGDRVAAAQLSLSLVGVVLVILLTERMQRGGRGFDSGRRFDTLPEYRLEGTRAWLATAACFLPIALGFLLPLIILGRLSYLNAHALFGERYLTLILNSFTLAGCGAFATVLVGLVLAYAARSRPGIQSTIANRLVSLGYAMPGSIIAVGLLIPLTTFDNALDAWMRATLGISTGLLLTGTIAALVFAYMVRFMAVALNTLEASLGKITLSIDEAARTLGAGTGRLLFRVHLPLISGGVLTAALIVFVDILKELPATLIMRPFNFDTLAIQAYRLASDERLAEASTPSLVIMAVGLLPVLLLSRQIARTRPGSGS
ncbi:ABC transporter permease [Amorphus coralli]|uniref:ABC transporter permease n=1 Tax=Amorphus coralli TaxID=340680 RepID=UPI00037A8C55|nr:iron ABC transporter permease [Amorphus coralli]